MSTHTRIPTTTVILIQWHTNKREIMSWSGKREYPFVLLTKSSKTKSLWVQPKKRERDRAKSVNISVKGVFNGYTEIVMFGESVVEGVRKGAFGWVWEISGGQRKSPKWILKDYRFRCCLSWLCSAEQSSTLLQGFTFATVYVRLCVHLRGCVLRSNRQTNFAQNPKLFWR